MVHHRQQKRHCSTPPRLSGLILIGVMALGACNQVADESDCDRAYNHLVAIKTQGEPDIVRKLKAEELEPQRFVFLEACVGRTGKKVIECWLGAKTTTALKACRNER